MYVQIYRHIHIQIHLHICTVFEIIFKLCLHHTSKFIWSVGVVCFLAAVPMLLFSFGAHLSSMMPATHRSWHGKRMTSMHKL